MLHTIIYQTNLNGWVYGFSKLLHKTLFQRVLLQTKTPEYIDDAKYLTRIAEQLEEMRRKDRERKWILDSHSMMLLYNNAIFL